MKLMSWESVPLPIAQMQFHTLHRGRLLQDIHHRIRDAIGIGAVRIFEVVSGALELYGNSGFVVKQGWLSTDAEVIFNKTAALKDSYRPE